MTAWRRYQLEVALPHLAPGRLSEVELLKVLGARQWTTLAGLVGLAPDQIRDDTGRRLWASMVAVELDLAGRALEDFDEGVTLELANRVGVFGKRLIEGLFVLDREPISDAELEPLRTAGALARAGRPWALLASAFVSRAPGDPNLVIATPAAFAAAAGLPELESMPAAVAEQPRVERSGRIAPLAADGPDRDDAGVPLAIRDERPARYRIEPESDLSGAGILYCARFVAIANIGERLHLCRNLARPFSTPLAAQLSTEHRRIYYFANAGPGDGVRISVDARLLPAPPPRAPAQLRTPFKLLARIDLARASDGVLIASTLVRKALRVPGSRKSLLHEAERIMVAAGLQ
jgi:probable biosynthetic protein (TIGR04098 family)